MMCLNDLKEEELPNHRMFALFSGIFFVVNFTLRENLIQNYTPTQIKCFLEYAFFIKSSYNYIPVILTHKRDTVKGI